MNTFRLARYGTSLLVIVLVGMALWLQAIAPDGSEKTPQNSKTIHKSIRQASEAAKQASVLGKLPTEVSQTINRIREGGPFPYERDGITFGNFEKRLPPKPRGYYREYTVPTPGRRDRGPRRVVTGAQGEFYYTDDHYQSFREVIPP